ncbi:MAG: hypothetical protein ACPL8I_00535 [Chloroflexaceae bacterium]
MRNDPLLPFAARSRRAGAMVRFRGRPGGSFLAPARRVVSGAGPAGRLYGRRVAH